MRCADGQWCNFLSVVHSICVVERLYRLILQIQIIDQRILVDKFGEYPPHYVAEVLLESLHEKHVQKELDS